RRRCRSGRAHHQLPLASRVSARFASTTGGTRPRARLCRTARGQIYALGQDTAPCPVIWPHASPRATTGPPVPCFGTSVATHVAELQAVRISVSTGSKVRRQIGAG